MDKLKKELSYGAGSEEGSDKEGWARIIEEQEQHLGEPTETL